MYLWTVFKAVFKSKEGYIHAEIKSGKNEIFHTTLKNEGKPEFKNPDDEFVLSPYDIFMPRRKELLSISDNPSQSYSDLLKKVQTVISTKGEGVRLTVGSLLSVAFKRTRKADYRFQDALQTDKKKYVCSSSIASFFADSGVDLGKEIDTTAEKIFPEQFSHMSTFTKVEESKLEDYNAMQNLKELLHHEETSNRKYLQAASKVKKKGFLTTLLLEIYRGLGLQSSSPLHAAKQHLTDDLGVLAKAIDTASAA